MRAGFLAGALAALAIAVPAAAQPDAGEVLREAGRVLAASHPPEVRDYTFTLNVEGLELPVYVHRDGGEWKVAMPQDRQLSQVGTMVVLWPELAGQLGGMALLAQALDAARYVRASGVEDRAVHVVTMGPEASAAGRDSMLLYVDAQNHRVLRMHVGGAVPGSADQPGGGARMAFTVDMLDHDERDGLVIPYRLRLRVRMEVPPMTEDQRTQAEIAFSQRRRELYNSTDPGAEEARVMLDLYAHLLVGREADLGLRIDRVRVNAGPPEWMN